LDEKLFLFPELSDAKGLLEKYILPGILLSLPGEAETQRLSATTLRRNKYFISKNFVNKSSLVF
jgi:hypothetical protein